MEERLSTKTDETPRFAVTTSRQFASWLASTGSSLAATYQSGKILLFGTKPTGGLAIFERTLDRPMGLATSGPRLAVASLTQIVTFVDAADDGPRPEGPFDAVYIPQVAHFTGDLDTHDLAFDPQGRIPPSADRRPPASERATGFAPNTPGDPWRARDVPSAFTASQPLLFTVQLACEDATRRPAWARTSGRADRERRAAPSPKKIRVMFPDKRELTICFAHPAYQMHKCFAARDFETRSFQVHEKDELQRRLSEADVLVVSGFWTNELFEQAPKLKFIQSIGAGTDQFDRDLLRGKGVRLASAQGVNERAVSQHALALVLAMARRLPEARDNQAKHLWRGMVSNLAHREDELTGKTMLVIGLGRIGGRLAGLAKAFDMRVVGVRRDPEAGSNNADSVHRFDRLPELLLEADIVVLTCPLTPETRGIVGREALARMKPSAILVNVARGACVDEAALIEALQAGRIAGAGIDVTTVEPLDAASPLWDMPNVLITPHTAGETWRYEENVVDILVENLGRLSRGETTLCNQIV